MAEPGSRRTTSLLVAALVAGVIGAPLHAADLPHYESVLEGLGEAASEALGSSAASIGDFNGDGRPDFAIGAPGVDWRRGHVYVYLGWPEVGDDPDLILAGSNTDIRFGYTVAGIGDVNGDGFDDLAVGAPDYPANSGGGTGRVFLFWGGEQPDDEWDEWLGTTGYPWAFGHSIAAAGDVNGDGYADILVGEALSNPHVSLFLGGPTLDSVPDIYLVPQGGYYRNFGWSLDGAGDINGDGFDDVIIGTPYFLILGGHIPRVGIYLGGPGMTGEPDQVIYGDDVMYGGQRRTAFGYSVAGLGDLNGDGFADFGVGAPHHQAAGHESGRAYVFYGDPDLDVAAARRVTWTGTVQSGRFGQVIAPAPDLNGDGAPEILVAAPGRGVVYDPPEYLSIYSGALDSAPLLEIHNPRRGELFGHGVAAVGRRILIGAPANDELSNDAGKFYTFAYEIEVAIDIRPGTESNQINLSSNAAVPVAVLSTSDFDATAVDPVSVRLADAPVIVQPDGTLRFELRDVDGDGLTDLEFRVRANKLDLDENSTEATIKGLTYDGVIIGGTDAVRIAGNAPTAPLPERVGDPRHVPLDEFFLVRHRGSRLQIEFAMKTAGTVRVTAYDVAGRKVDDVVHASLGVGRHVREWNPIGPSGRRLPDGIYFLRLTTRGQGSVKRVLLTRP